MNVRPSSIGNRIAVGSLVIAGVFSMLIVNAEDVSTTSQDVVVPIEELKFPAPFAYGSMKEVSFTVLWSDPATQRASIMTRTTKGTAPRHYHKGYDMEVLLVKGSMIHWIKSQPESGKRRLNPGSYWFQPANQVHQNTCLSDECIFLNTTFGKGEGDTDVEVSQ